MTNVQIFWWFMAQSAVIATLVGVGIAIASYFNGKHIKEGVKSLQEILAKISEMIGKINETISQQGEMLQHQTEMLQKMDLRLERMTEILDKIDERAEFRHRELLEIITRK